MWYVQYVCMSVNRGRDTGNEEYSVVFVEDGGNKEMMVWQSSYLR